MIDGAQRWCLVVDDEDSIRDLTAFALSRRGFRCDTAADGEEALVRVSERQYDLIITDLQMPRMHGHALVRNLREQDCQAVIIVLTSVVEPNLLMELYKLGVADFLFKPVDTDMLAVKAIALLERQSAAPVGAASGEGGGQTAETMAEKLNQTTSELRNQLKAIEADFLGTIKNLEEQKGVLQSKCVESVRVLSTLMEQFNHLGECHASRVEEMSRALFELAQPKNLDDHELMLAALLHDVGLFGLPDEIISKALLDIHSDEHKTFRRYPLIGATLVSQIADAQTISEMVLRHRENFDGSGFPDGFEGNSILIGARIIRVADAMDMELIRVGEEDSKLDFSRQFLKEKRGSWFDPTLVDAALAGLKTFIKPHLAEGTKEVRARNLRTGDVLAEDLRDRSGRMILSRGATITDGMLTHLSRVRLPTDLVRIRVR
jgi:response regulator RpfG family c-di-GMP phosphodiesterase